MATPTADPRGRKPYRAPELITYGLVRDLTQGGSTNATELTPGGTCPPGHQSDITHKDCAPCERRLKQDIVRVGTHPLGIGLYLFRYRSEYRDRCGHGRQFGVMIDEVERVAPQALAEGADGLRVVDFAALGIQRRVQ